MESQYIRNYRHGQTRIDTLEKKIAMLYCISLPFRMFSQLSFLKGALGGCANYLPFLFHVLGMLLWIANDKGKLRVNGKEELTGYALKLTVWLNVSSIIMAIVIQTFYGNQGSENAFQGIVGMLIYFVQYFLMFLYNYRVFRLLTIDELNKLLHIDCVVLLVIGYMQILVMNGIGAGIYDVINFLEILKPSGRMAKLCLSCNEGAGAGTLIGVFVLPYLLSQIISGHRRCYYELLLWLVPIYYTFSSTAYLLAVTDILVFVILSIIRSENPLKNFTTFVVVIICASIIVVLLFNLGVLNNRIVDEMDYLLFHKGTDLSNGSTASRTVVLLVNWGAFTEFPVLGVGNGLQGYFYEKYFPDWALKTAGSDVQVFLQRSQGGISNGGVFIPSLLSGYGIVGIALILAFVWKCIQSNALNRLFNQNFYYMYLIAGLAFIFMGFQGDAYGLYFAWFVVSIPFMTKKEEAQA